MPTLDTHGISLYYETHGDPSNPPVLLISGLGGIGASWGPQVHLFARNYWVILPDQRGTGRSTHAGDGYTTEGLAAEMAALVEHLGVLPVHVVGASTGGAIAQHMVLQTPQLVASLTLSSTFARFDSFMQREFAVRRRLAAEWDREALMEGYSLFLFSPRYTREHPEAVQEWIDRAAGAPVQPGDIEVGLARIDMIAAHDTSGRLSRIERPTLVLSGTHNACTLLANSEDLAAAIPAARLVTFEQAGELIELEQPERYFAEVSAFIDAHR